MPFFKKNIGVKECALGLHSIAKPKINLFLPLISHYVISFQELQQKLDKGGCGLSVVEKPLVNRI